MTLLFFLGVLVLHHYVTAAGHASVHENQGAMRVYGQRLGFFLERMALGVLSTNAHRHLH
jgi:hypothetical protein